MTTLFATVENLLVNRLINNQAPFTGSSKFGLGLITLAVFMFLMSMGFFTWGAYLWMSNNLDPLTAAIITGGITFMIATLCLLGTYGLIKYKQYRLSKFKDEITKTIGIVMSELTNEQILDPVKDNPKTAMLIASVAGLVLGDQIITRS